MKRNMILIACIIFSMITGCSDSASLGETSNMNTETFTQPSNTASTDASIAPSTNSTNPSTESLGDVPIDDSTSTQPSEAITQQTNSVTVPSVESTLPPTEPISDIPTGSSDQIQSSDATMPTQPTDSVTTPPADSTDSPTDLTNDAPTDASDQIQPSEMIPHTQPTEETPPSPPAQSDPTTSTEDNTMNNNCTLVVNGRDITDGVYVYLNTDNYDVEIPLTAVMKELGANVEWKDEHTVAIEHNGDEVVIDITEEAFGIPLPPGATHYARNIVDGEIIIDSTSVNGLIRWMGAYVRIDYENRIVEIW